MSLSNRLGKLYTEDKNYDEVLSLWQNNNDFFKNIPRANKQKIIRNLIAMLPASLGIHIRF